MTMCDADAAPLPPVPDNYKMATSLVPETLLALIKDERYIQQCQTLLKASLEKLGLADNISSLGLAWLLYSLLVVRRAGKTLGMEFTGLRTSATKSNRNRLWWTMALTACSSMAIHYYMFRVDPQQQQQQENLRGSARRRFHEQQRRVMMARASSCNNNLDGMLTKTAAKRHQPRRDLLKKLREFLLETIHEISTASSQAGGPHALPGTSMTFAKWLLKLHLAHFCWTGRFPSWLYRLDGVPNLEGDRANHRPNLLANKPESHKLIAMLITLRAMGEAVKWCGCHVAEWIVRRQRRQQKEEIGKDSTSLTTTRPLSTTTTSTVCAICRLPRIHSAVPSTCGHVFCWSCLQQAVASKQECPLCRAKCRRQDVLMLYQYSK
jgi:peroxin-10